MYSLDRGEADIREWAVLAPPSARLLEKLRQNQDDKARGQVPRNQLKFVEGKMVSRLLSKEERERIKKMM